MEKLYGYKEKDVLGLCEYLKNKKGTLVNVFKKYAKDNNKSVGTVRNLYYALVKISNEDANFCKTYLGGKPFFASKMEFFNDAEEKELVKKILLLKSEGYSVRSAINFLANGDTKLALRYQNKYRGIICNKKEKVMDAIKELKSENPNFSVSVFDNKTYKKGVVNDFYVSRIKKEINALYDRLNAQVKQENEELKSKIKVLEMENLRLREENLEKISGGKVKEYCMLNAIKPAKNTKL